MLREAGVTSALLHGGTSSVHAIGRPEEGDAWKVAIEKPGSSPTSQSDLAAARGQSSLFSPHLPQKKCSTDPAPPSESRPVLLATVPLKDEAMSVSGIQGKFFQAGGKTFGHILDPRTGQPASTAVLAAVVLPSATETDALSTALLTLGPDGHEKIANLRPGIRTVVASESGGRLHVEARNIMVEPRV